MVVVIRRNENVYICIYIIYYTKLTSSVQKPLDYDDHRLSFQGKTRNWGLTVENGEWIM